MLRDIIKLGLFVAEFYTFILLNLETAMGGLLRFNHPFTRQKNSRPMIVNKSVRKLYKSPTNTTYPGHHVVHVAIADSDMYCRACSAGSPVQMAPALPFPEYASTVIE